LDLAAPSTRLVVQGMQLEGRQVNYISVTEIKTNRVVWINTQSITAVEHRPVFGSIISLSSKSGFEVAETVDEVMDTIRSALS
jgi:hypothetical protein